MNSAEEIDRANAQLAQVAHIRRFHLLTKELDHDDDEVTAEVVQKHIVSVLARAMGIDLGGWSFGAQFGDLNNDGIKDLIIYEWSTDQVKTFLNVSAAGQAATTVLPVGSLADLYRAVWSLGQAGVEVPLIPSRADQNPFAHWRRPMVMMRQG